MNAFKIPKSICVPTVEESTANNYPSQPKPKIVEKEKSDKRQERRLQKEIEKMEKSKVMKELKEIRELEKMEKKQMQSQNVHMQLNQNKSTPHTHPHPSPSPSPSPSQQERPRTQYQHQNQHTHTNNYSSNPRPQSKHPTHSQHPSHQPPRPDNLPLDYHLRQQRVTDNPKKIPKFDFIKVIPKGIEYAIYLQSNSIIFCNMNSSIPSATIAHKSNIRNALLFATMVNQGFCVITNIIFYNGHTLSTYGERLKCIASIFEQGVLSNINSSSNAIFSDITFSVNHLFNSWTEFTRESLHIPYEIKHLEYCFYGENLNRQTDRYIYILNKKNLKKQPNKNTDLVHTTSREFRVDHSIEEAITKKTPLLDFKECILKNIPYFNIVGYSHLDKQEESDEE